MKHVESLPPLSLSVHPLYPLALTPTLPYLLQCPHLTSAFCLTDGHSGSQRPSMPAGGLLQTPGESQSQCLPSGAPKSEGAPNSC